MVTPGGPLGFQVNATGLDHEARLIGDFSTLAEAEAFADSDAPDRRRPFLFHGAEAIGLTRAPSNESQASSLKDRAAVLQ